MLSARRFWCGITYSELVTNVYRKVKFGGLLPCSVISLHMYAHTHAHTHAHILAKQSVSSVLDIPMMLSDIIYNLVKK